MDAQPFRAQDAAWIQDTALACEQLREAPLAELGYITDASNGAVLCRLGDPADNVFAVHKPEVMERPLWDFPDGTLHRREVAAHLVSEALGWGLIPPTVLRDGQHGVGSLQLFVPHDPAEHYFVLVDEPRWAEPLAKLAMFDFLTNNADRKGGHILRHLGLDRLFGIDNGLTFHVETKVRTVVWDIAHVPFAEDWKADLRRLAELLGSPTDPLVLSLSQLMSPAEVSVLARRADLVAGMPHVPVIDPDHRHYPWPPV